MTRKKPNKNKAEWHREFNSLSKKEINYKISVIQSKLASKKKEIGEMELSLDEFYVYSNQLTMCVNYYKGELYKSLSSYREGNRLIRMRIGEWNSLTMLCKQQKSDLETQVMARVRGMGIELAIPK